MTETKPFYGYRAGKSAHQALDVTRKRCWQYGWVLEYDIRGLFDHIDHGLLMKALRHHTDNKWVLLYVQRWLTAPMQKRDGSLISREVGTPQGGPTTPLTTVHKMISFVGIGFGAAMGTV